MPRIVDCSCFGNMGFSLWTCTIGIEPMSRWQVIPRSKRPIRKVRTSTSIAGENTVAVYTKHQKPRDLEFAMHRSFFASSVSLQIGDPWKFALTANPVYKDACSKHLFLRGGATLFEGNFEG